MTGFETPCIVEILTASINKPQIQNICLRKVNTKLCANASPAPKDENAGTQTGRHAHKCHDDLTNLVPFQDTVVWDVTWCSLKENDRRC